MLKKSLKNKVLLPIVSALVVSFIALIVIISVLNTKTLEKHTIEQSNATIQSTSLAVESYFSQYKRGLELLANNAELFKASQLSIDSNKLEVDALYNTLLPYTSLYKGVLSTHIGLENGATVIAPENNVPDNYDPRKRPWYIEAVAAKEAVWSEPYVDAFTNEMVITVSKPLYDSTNKLLGVVATDLSLAHLIETISNMDPGYGGSVMLVSTTGNAIVHKDLQDKNVFEQPSYRFLKELKEGDRQQYSAEVEKQLLVYQQVNELNWIIGALYPQENIQVLAATTTKILVITALVVLLVMIVLIMYIMSRITKPISELEHSSNRIATGDLTVKLYTSEQDEIGRLTNAFGEMIEKTSNTLQEVRYSVEQLSTESENLSAYAEQMNATSEQIALSTSSITTDAVTVSEEATKVNGLSEQLNSQMTIIQQNANRLANSAQQADTVNEAGLEQIQQLNSTNKAMQTRLVNMEQIMQSLDKGMYTINEITELITNISSQTNLLALNASIEAARAGEHGKGFAVVAEEVRKLAEQSAQASADVQHSIHGILENTKIAANEMQETNTHFSMQLDIMGKTSDAFQQLSQLVSDMQQAIQAIYTEVTEATSDTKVMRQQMNSILLASQQTVAATEQVAASTQEQSDASRTVAQASEELLQMSQQMKRLIEQFKLNVG